ncbi:stage III sporulation protein AE [Anaeroselena agilis]|uniref:Stage III sporulation protein AE n=1 Tax=Anaeroselena agilis TaxID=3063788 RepID=A0ABU3NW60_9FIRM|nr:stage III sporulation protein AE [Selenomonadales bacterium 4137-cl]
MRSLLTVALILLFLTSPVFAAPGDAAGELAEALSLDDVNRFIVKINRELNEDIPLLTGETIRGIAARGFSLDWESIKRAVAARLFKELAANAHLMGKLLFLAVLCALLQNLQNSFEHSTVSLLAYSICYIFLAVIALTAFYNAITLARDTVGNMVGFMEALLPLLISLLAGVGAVTTAALFTPLMLFVVGTVSIVVKDVVLPLFFLAAVLQCVNFLSNKYQVTNLCGLFRQGGMAVLGLTLVVFVGVITVQGVAGGVADGVALRTAKYATATFIPVVGKMFADTVELVMGASLLLKNAIGLFGIATVLTLCALPLIKLVSLIVVIKLAGALVQPMGDEKMAKCLDGMGDNLMLVFGGVLAVAVMFFLTITMIVGVGSVTMMLR